MLNDPWLHGTRPPAPVQFPDTRATCWESAAQDGRVTWFCVVSLIKHPPYDVEREFSGETRPLTLAPNVPARLRPRHGANSRVTMRTLSDRPRDWPPGQRWTWRMVVMFTFVHMTCTERTGCFAARGEWVPLLVRAPGGEAGRDTAAVSLTCRR